MKLTKYLKNIALLIAILVCLSFRNPNIIQKNYSFIKGADSLKINLFFDYTYMNDTLQLTSYLIFENNDSVNYCYYYFDYYLEKESDNILYFEDKYPYNNPFKGVEFYGGGDGGIGERGKLKQFLIKPKSMAMIVESNKTYCIYKRDKHKINFDYSYFRESEFPYSEAKLKITTASEGPWIPSIRRFQECVLISIKDKSYKVLTKVMIHK